MLRWARPGRQAYLLVLAVLVAALLRLVAAAGRLLIAVAEGAMLMEPAALMARRHGLAGLGVRAGARPQMPARRGTGREPDGTDLR